MMVNDGPAARSESLGPQEHKCKTSPELYYSPRDLSQVLDRTRVSTSGLFLLNAILLTFC